MWHRTALTSEKAFGQRRGQIVGDSYQLRLDVDHYNDVHPEDPQISLILDFTDDVKEMIGRKGDRRRR